MKFRNIMLFLTLLIMVVAVPFIIYTAKQKQELRKKAAPATVLSISPAGKDVKTGEKFTLDVKIETGENTVSAVELAVNFDKTKLKGESIAVGDFLTVPLVEGAVGDGKMTMTLGSPPASPKKGTGTLAKITLTALDSIGNTVVSFDEGTRAAGIKETDNVVINKSSATVKIIADEGDTPTATPTPVDENPTATPTRAPTATPTPTPTEETSGSSDSTDGNGSGGRTDNRLSESERSYEFVLTSPPKGSVVKTPKPLIKGKAKPGSTITYTIYSEPITGVVTADVNGNFAFSPDSPLADASHNITLTEEASDGTSRTLASNFVVQTKPPPVSGNIKPILIIGGVAIGLILLGFGIPLLP